MAPKEDFSELKGVFDGLSSLVEATVAELNLARNERDRAREESGKLAQSLTAQIRFNHELLRALKDCRNVLERCRTDCAGTQTEEYFEAKVRYCDAVIGKAKE